MNVQEGEGGQESVVAEKEHRCRRAKLRQKSLVSVACPAPGMNPCAAASASSPKLVRCVEGFGHRLSPHNSFTYLQKGSSHNYGIDWVVRLTVRLRAHMVGLMDSLCDHVEGLQPLNPVASKYAVAARHTFHKSSS
jgi:hypothetical protein